MSDQDQLVAARLALSHCDWQGAYDLTSGALVPDTDLGGEADRLDVYADAAWWLGRLDECIEAREGAYARYEELGDQRRAGQCAVWLYEHNCFKARPAIAGGWLRRARHALGNDPESAEYGALRLREAETAHGSGNLRESADMAREIVDLSRRLRSPDLEAEALQALGRVLIDDGDPTEGLATLDEAMLFAVEGRLRPYSTGKVYCSLISACEALGDLRRAAEWSEATTRWAQRHPFAVFPGLCRVHLASALRSRGEWDEAEEQAVRACAELATLNVTNAAAGYAEIGEIRRRIGDLDGAEDAFHRAEQLSGQPQPGLALLRLAQGNIDAAVAIITRALNEITWDRLGRARLLPARAQIAIAAGDLPGAIVALDELDAIASDFASPALIAAALSTRGRVQLASSDRSACATLHQAAERWQELGVPHELATARMLQGAACRGAGDLDGAAASLEAAGTLFEQLGATLDLRNLRDISSTAPDLPAGLTKREVEVLRLVADGMTNKQIAQQLFLSEKTVARHLSNIFTKIDVASRSAATAFAFEHRLVP
jgi:Response regulator containing a CheY-like receiver domain and an HTH DNA-binding domain